MPLAVALPVGRKPRAGALASPARALWLAVAILALVAGGVLAGENGSGARAAAPTPPAGQPARAVSASAAWAGVPLPARLAVARALGADDAAYRVRTTPTGFGASSAAAGDLAFGPQGADLRTPAGNATLRLRGPAVSPTARANRVLYAHGPVTEWYANGPLGLEQGFDVARPTARHGVTLDLVLGGSLGVRTAAGGLDFVGPDGLPALRLTGLAAADARGRRLPAQLVLHGRRARISVDTRHARFPVTVDPLVQRATLTASDGFAGEHLGNVAVDGSTIVVGAPSATVAGNRQGAVYVFTRPAGGWSDGVQVAKLIASDATNLAAQGGYYGDSLGSSVAVSGDTVVAGAPIGADGSNPGRLYVFVKPANGWVNSVQNAELNPSDPTQNGQLGSAAAIDGDTIVGASAGDYRKPGEIYVWTKPAGGWTSVTQTARLTDAALDGDEALGRSVDVSGGTIVAGAPFLDNGGTVAGGAAFVWAKPDGQGWEDAQPTAKLVAAQPITQETLGSGVAVDGATILAGASHAQSQGNTRPPGSVYVFVKPPGGWTGTQAQTARLTASDPQDDDEFGASVGISGSRVVAGVPVVGGSGGATYVFDEPTGGWVDGTQADKVMDADGGTEQGSSVAVSGATVVASEPYATAGGNGGQGGAAVFEPGTTTVPPSTTTGPTTSTTTTGPTTSTTTTGPTTSTTTPATTQGTTTTPPPATTAPDVMTFAVPTGQITNPDAPTPPPDLTTAADIIAGLFGIKAGSGETVNLGEFTFVAYCSKPAGQCAAGTSFGQQLGHNTAAGTRAAFRAHAKTSAAVLAKGSFVVPAGQKRTVAVKLTKAGRKLLAKRHRITGYLTLSVKLDDGTTASSSRRLTLRQAKRKKR